MPKEVSCVLLAEDLDLEMEWAWRRHCSEIPGVSLYSGQLLRAPIDALVLIPDCFGQFLTNEDRLVVGRWPHLQEQILAGIRTALRGELAVGQSIVLPTGTNDIRGVVISPSTFAGLPEKNGPWPYLFTRAAILGLEMSTILSEDATRLGIYAPKAWRNLVSADSWARQVAEAILSLRQPYFISGNAVDSVARVNQILGDRNCISNREGRAILRAMNEHGWICRDGKWHHPKQNGAVSSDDAISIWRCGGIWDKAKGIWIDPVEKDGRFYGQFIEFSRIVDWLVKKP